jgi:hypothetical protein
MYSAVAMGLKLGPIIPLLTSPRFPKQSGWHSDMDGGEFIERGILLVLRGHSSTNTASHKHEPEG